MPLLKVYQNIYSSESLTSLLESLVYNEFVKRIKPESGLIHVDREQIRKCIWMGSILAESKEESHIKKVQLLAALLYLNYDEDIEVTKSAYILFSRTGNLLSTKFFSKLFNKDITTNQFVFNAEFDFLLDVELNNTKNDSTIKFGEENYITTRFQKKLWDSLEYRNNISISAPTSAGKSFIIKKFIKKKLQSSNRIRVLYIVPSRALINQVSEEFRIDVNTSEVDIKTAFIEESQQELNQNKQLFIFTPERCLKLLQHSWKNEFKLDIIFVDEIQNAEDEGGRGTLFEYVLREIALLNSTAQIVTAGPNIINTQDLHNRLFGFDSLTIQTTLSPVFQIKTIVRVENNSIYLTINSKENKEFELQIQTETNISRKFDSSIGEGLTEIIKRLTADGKNIIYSPKTNWAEDWALKYADTLEYITLDNELEELIEFLREEIHPKYYLIDCLQKGIAFHHSKLPDIIRKEIENLFVQGKITNLFCTSTLLEGVNLPANNLFVVIPSKMNDRLTPFEFGNLIGRAGRIKDSLYGRIYCIERKIEEKWAEDYYEKSYGKEIVTVSEKTLRNFAEFKDKLSSTNLEINSKDTNSIIFFRQKLISGEDEFKKYLSIKKVSKENIELMFTILNSTLSNISLSPEIIRLNPTIDPITQNDLYNDILNSGIISWVLVPNSNFNKRITRANKDQYNHNETSFFWQLVSIVEKLDKFFNLGREAAIKHNISLSIAQMCINGVNWMTNKSYRELIISDLNFYSTHINPNKQIDLNNRKDVNIRINEVIKINTTIVSYILVKYLKLLNDILSSLMSDSEKEKFKFSLSLPTMMELGTTETIVIQLISSGIPRSIALKVFSVFKNVDDYQEKDVFKWLSEQTTLGLKGIYERYLVNLKVLKLSSVQK